MNALDRLPIEILLQILEILHARDLLSFSATSKQYQSLVRSNSQLQLIIELSVEGLRQRNSSIVNLIPGTDKLQAYRRWLQSWKNFQPLSRCNIPVYGGFLYLRGDLFGQGVLDETGHFRSLEIRELSTSDTAGNATLWKVYKNLDIEIVDFTFDQGQNLLALVEKPSIHPSSFFDRIHLRTLSDNMPHPAASTPHLEISASRRWAECDLKVCGSTLACYFYHLDVWLGTYNWLYIWDWKTGEKIFARDNIGGYAFVTSTIFITVNLLSTRSRTEDPDDPLVNMEMFNIHDLDAKSVILHLPLVRLPNRVIVMSDIPGTSSSPSTLVDAVGEEESADRLIYLCFFPLNQRLLISAKHLLQIYNNNWPYSCREEAGEDEQVTRRRYSWSQWGPPSSCWFPLNIVRASLISVYGSQFCGTVNIQLARTRPDQFDIMKRFGFDMKGIQLAESEDAEIKFILDFNQRPFKKFGDKVNPPGAPLVWDLEGDVHGRIESQLPFRLYQRRSATTCDVIYMTHFRVLAGYDDHYEVMRFYD
ncbi:hypothetical protein CPB86DRAFT_819040 [Serendipita vermifera]|nr:hypothetical protein CPB86DRAFT_819040 [Serendipita vermifera]